VGDSGIVARWASFGISGMRLDVADELPDEFIASIKQRLAKKNPNAILYGEVWEDASNKIAYGKRKKYFHGKELDGVMNYPLREAIISYLRDGDITKMHDYIDEVMPNMPRRVLHVQMNLIGTHDTVRAITALAGALDDGHTNAELFEMKLSESELKLGIMRLKQAMAILTIMPGLPMIYYGDEAGMQGYSDPFNRLPYPWGRENSELLSFYRSIDIWRRKRSALRCGAFRALSLDRDVLVFERRDENERILLIVNRSNTTCKKSYNGEIDNLIGGRTLGAAVEVEPNGFAVFTVADH
jgi:glycosidase